MLSAGRRKTARWLLESAADESSDWAKTWDCNLLTKHMEKNKVKRQTINVLRKHINDDFLSELVGRLLNDAGFAAIT